MLTRCVHSREIKAVPPQAEHPDGAEDMVNHLTLNELQQAFYLSWDKQCSCLAHPHTLRTWLEGHNLKLHNQWSSLSPTQHGSHSPPPRKRQGIPRPTQHSAALATQPNMHIHKGAFRVYFAQEGPPPQDNRASNQHNMAASAPCSTAWQPPTPGDLGPGPAPPSQHKSRKAGCCPGNAAQHCPT